MLTIYTVRDTKSNFGPLMSFRGDGEAIRAFTEACMDTNGSLYRYPSDYQLVRLGTYDDETGSIVADDGITFVIDAETAIALAARARQAAAERIGQADLEEAIAEGKE